MDPAIVIAVNRRRPSKTTLANLPKCFLGVLYAAVEPE
jgi:hypothetical protein